MNEESKEIPQNLSFESPKEQGGTELLIKQKTLQRKDTSRIKKKKKQKQFIQNELGQLEVIEIQVNQAEEKTLAGQLEETLSRTVNYVRTLPSQSEMTSLFRIFEYSPLPVIYQKSKVFRVLIFWKMSVFILMIEIIFRVSYQICFRYFYLKKLKQKPPEGFQIQQIIGIVTLTLDIILNFHVTYIQKGRYVRIKEKIARKYFVKVQNYQLAIISKGFLRDAVAIVLSLIFFMVQNQYARILCLFLFSYLKVQSFGILDDVFQEKLENSKNWLAVYKISKILFMLLSLTHIMACFFYLSGQLSMNLNENFSQKSWLNTPGNFGEIQNLPPLQQYFLTLYWSFGNLSTIPNGDITPMNLLEIGVNIIAIILALNIFALSLSLIQESIREITSEEDLILKQHQIVSDIDSKVRIMARYMTVRNIPKDIQKKIQEYLYELFYQQRNNNADQEQALIDQLTPQLKHDLLYFTFQKFQSQLPISEFLSFKVLKSLIVAFEELTYCEGDIIYLDRQEPIDGYAFYFINLGEVGLFYNMNKDSPSKIFFKLGEGDLLGYYSFLFGQPRETSAVALSYCRLFALSRDKFFLILKNYQEDLQQFHMFVDTVQWNPVDGDFVCYACNNINFY